MRLFGPPDPEDIGPAKYREPNFAYLERTARPEFAKVRAQMEIWVAAYPEAEREDLIKRMRSHDDQHSSAAFFELYLYTLFRKLGYEADVHPEAGDRGRRPDFRIQSEHGAKFFLEAAVVSESSNSGRAAASRINDINDAINTIECPDFFLHLEHYGKPAAALSLKRIKQSVVAFIATLDYEQVRADVATLGFDGRPKGEFTDGDYTLTFAAHPVRPDRRGYQGHRPVGMNGPGEAYWADDSTPLRDKVKHKAGRYGHLDTGLVIAVNMLGRHVDTTDVMNALFGEETFSIPIDDYEKAEPVMRRMRNGAWVGPSGPINRSVSAVLVVSSLLPWSIATESPDIFHNPYAKYPALDLADRLVNFRQVRDKFLPHEGEAIHSILGLNPGWPNDWTKI